MKLEKRTIKLAAQVALCTLILFFSGSAFPQTPFYRGKTITVIATTSPGGTGDLRVKAVVPFLASMFREIPRF